MKSQTNETMNKMGFTLIELLVVIAIIGLLASVVLVSLSGARSKGRDAKRRADLKELQAALELYANNNNGLYPVTSAWVNSGSWGSVGTALSPAYIGSMPHDPSGDGAAGCPISGVTHMYYYESLDGVGYKIGSCLENPITPSDGMWDSTHDTGSSAYGAQICTSAASCAY